MPNQLKTRVQAIDSESGMRRWVDMEIVNHSGIELTVLRPGENDNDFVTIAKTYVLRDQYIGFMVGYLISEISASNKNMRDLIVPMLKAIIDGLDA